MGTNVVVECKCVCGKIRSFYLTNIIPSKNKRTTKSCGCKRSILVSKKVKKHGLSGTKFYFHWNSMRNRMLPTFIDARSYIGVSVCERWKSFDNFKEDMYESWVEHENKYGGRNTSLDRINVYGNYEPLNCRWATAAEQSVNKKNTLYVELEGRKTPLVRACSILGKDYDQVFHRMRRGESFESSVKRGLWERRKNNPRL